MDSKKIVYSETFIVLIGQAVCIGAMLGVYALLGRLDGKVVLGGIVGGALAAMNFFLMAVCTSLAADRAQNQDVKGGQSLLQMSYILRLVLLAVILFACGKSGLMDLLALVLPLAFVRPIITIAEFFRKKGEETA